MAGRLEIAGAGEERWRAFQQCQPVVLNEDRGRKREGEVEPNDCLGVRVDQAFAETAENRLATVTGFEPLARRGYLSNREGPVRDVRLRHPGIRSGVAAGRAEIDADDAVCICHAEPTACNHLKRTPGH